MNMYFIRVPCLKFVGFPVLKIWLIFGHGVKRPGTLTFDLSTSKWGHGVNKQQCLHCSNGVMDHPCLGLPSCQFSAFYAFPFST